MTCERWRDLILTDYLDGELSDADRQGLAAHVAGCPSCRDLMEKAPTTLVKPFEALEHPAPPPRVWAGVVQELGLDPQAVDPDRAGVPPGGSAAPAAPVRGWAGRHPWLVFGLGVAVVALLVAGFLFWRQADTAGRPSPAAVEGVVHLMAGDPDAERVIRGSLAFDTPEETFFLPPELFPGERLSK
ncbi:MAG: hypothetical protein GX442_16305 [Candidatus Riflebacteria bacterium]|nr:hypothetical protein [Candidatus Riflebacteria bacterium]